jgi:hypothetical protein
LVSLCERWLDQQRAIQRCYARYSPGDPPDALIIGLLNGSDDIERQIADTPAATRQGIQAKGQAIVRRFGRSRRRHLAAWPSRTCITSQRPALTLN